MRANRSYLLITWLASIVASSIINFFYFPHGMVFPDEQRFMASAIRLASTGEFWVGSDRAWEMPGTAVFFAPFVRLFGAEAAVPAIRTAQSTLVIVQSALVALTAQQIFGRMTAAYIAASLVAFYPFILFQQGLLLSETLFNTFLIAGVASLYRWRQQESQIDWSLVIACLCFALATLTKATLTILPPLLIAATAWAAGVTFRRTFTIFITASCLYCGFLSPWWIRNAELLHSFVPFTTGSAQNLYLGNNPRNTDGGVDWSTNAEPTLVERISDLPGEVERQHAYSRAAINYIQENPAAFIRSTARKFIRFWNLVPNASEFRTDLYTFASLASFGPVLALALLCAIRWRRRWRLLVPFYFIIGYFTAVHVITIASLRYRLPIEPLLILLAAEPLATIIERRQAISS